jgi:hypothetical protein
MENLKTLKPMEEEKEPAKEDQEGEEMKSMPFGLMGINFLCNLTQYAAYLGITVLIIAIIRIFGPK